MAITRTFFDNQIHQPYYRVQVGFRDSDGKINSSFDATESLAKLITGIKSTREAGGASKIEISTSYGISDELSFAVEGRGELANIPPPYYWLMVRSPPSVQISVDLGYRNLSPDDRFINIIPLTPDLKIQSSASGGVPFRAMVQQQASVFVGPLEKPSVSGDSSGVISSTMTGKSSIGVKDNPSSLWDVRFRDSRGKEVRGSHFERQSKDSQNQNLIRLKDAIKSAVEDSNLFPEEYLSEEGIEFDYTGIETATVERRDIPSWEPNFIPVLQSPLEYLNEICEHYGVEWVERPRDDSDSKDAGKVIMFLPASASTYNNYYIWLTQSRSDVQPVTSLPVYALELLYGVAVTNFNFTYNPVAAGSGSSVTVLAEDGETYQVQLDDAAIKAWVQQKYEEFKGKGGSISSGLSTAEFFQEWSKRDPTGFIAAFTVIVRNQSHRNAVNKTTGTGHSGVRLSVDLKWAIPGLVPGSLIYFDEPPKVGTTTQILPEAVKGIWKVNKVVDTFNASSEIMTQSLDCVFIRTKSSESEEQKEEVSA